MSSPRILAIAFALTLGLGAGPSCELQRRQGHGVTCGFMDARFVTSMVICLCAAEYYVENREWPQAMTELQEQHRQLLKDEDEGITAEERKEALAIWDAVQKVEFRQREEALELRYRFKIDGKTTRQTVTLLPGATSDEILESAAGE